MNQAYRMASGLSLKQLSYLLAVRDTLNFTRAAEACFVTQSTLSGGINELEKQLDVCLIERTRQHVAMTPIGLEVCARAEQILQLGSDLMAFAKAQSDPRSGSLRFGVIPTIAPFWLASAMSKLKKHFPSLTLYIRESQTEVLVQAVARGELDCAVLAMPVETGSLAVLPLFEEELCLVAPAGDSLSKQKRPVSLVKVDHDRLILLEKGHCLRDHSLAACSNAASESRQVEASSLPTMVQLVEAGMGVALLPRMAVESGLLKGRKVDRVALSGALPRRQVALIFRPSHPAIGFLEDCVSILKEEVS